MHFRYLFLLLIFFAGYSHAQTYKHVVYLKDKNNNWFTVSNPEQFLSQKAIQRRVRQQISIDYTDLPVTESYISQIKTAGGIVLAKSKWLNAILVDCDSNQLQQIQSLPFVKGSKRVARTIVKSNSYSISGESVQLLNDENYGASYSQNALIGVPDMHSKGFHGEGILIAVLDNGFYNLNNLSCFNHLFTNGKIKATYDFVNKETSVYNDGTHGMTVLSVMAGYQPGSLIGPAYAADFILLKTEDDTGESPAEEFYWASGAEFADSAGVDIISSSLGYNTFDDPGLNHPKADLDGNTAIITKAADFAAAKGIIVVNSAGNEGLDAWKTLNFPADGDSVLAVGATNNYGNYVSFSSRGFSADGRVKPDVAAQGMNVYGMNFNGSFSYVNGTSFSCPLIAGLAAGLLQAHPEATNMEIINALRGTASQTELPDSLMGYGVPNFTRAYQELSGVKIPDTDSFIFFPNPIREEKAQLILNSKLLFKDLKLLIFDATGKKIAEQKIYAVERLVAVNQDFTSLKPGVYFCHLTGAGFNHVVRVVR